MPRPRSLRTLTLSTSLPIVQTSGPVSPTFSATTNASQMDLRNGLGADKIITRADLRASQQAYDELISSCAAYRNALSAMSVASAGFAKAIEACSRLKGTTDEAAIGLQATSGLHHLMANHYEVLSASILQNFEKPLRLERETYSRVVMERSMAYERALLEKSKIIRQTESENMNIGRKKQRDLQSFRQALAILQSQVDELDRLKAEHYQQILEHEEEVWDVVVEKVSLVVRSSLEVFDRLTAKQTDPVLEPMLQAIPDPFNSYGPPKAEDQIFSILPPLAIMSTTGSTPNPSPVITNPELSPSPVVARTWMDEYQDPSSSEWGETKLPNTRRHSHPPPSPPHASTPTRRAESKLRNVLASIEERAADSSQSKRPISSAPEVDETEDRTAAWSQSQGNYAFGTAEEERPRSPSAVLPGSPDSDSTEGPVTT